MLDTLNFLCINKRYLSNNLKEINENLLKK